MCDVRSELFQSIFIFSHAEKLKPRIPFLLFQLEGKSLPEIQRSRHAISASYPIACKKSEQNLPALTAAGR
jgi:hypothetical protein